MNEKLILNIINNIYILCKKDSKYSIGKLEKFLKMRLGYFSRLKKNPVDIGICKILKICEYFDISIEDLIYKDYSKEEIKNKILEIEKQQRSLEESKILLLNSLKN